MYGTCTLRYRSRCANRATQARDRSGQTACVSDVDINQRNVIDKSRYSRPETLTCADASTDEIQTKPLFTVSIFPPLNSTQLNEHLWTQVLKHLRVHIYLYSLLYIKYYNQLDSRTDLSPIPVRSAVKSYKTSWCIQNLSKRALNRQTVSTSTTELGRQFHTLTIRAVKEYFRVS